MVSRCHIRQPNPLGLPLFCAVLVFLKIASLGGYVLMDNELWQAVDPFYPRSAGGSGGGLDGGSFPPQPPSVEPSIPAIHPPDDFFDGVDSQIAILQSGTPQLPGLDTAEEQRTTQEVAEWIQLENGITRRTIAHLQNKGITVPYAPDIPKAVNIALYNTVFDDKECPNQIERLKFYTRTLFGKNSILWYEIIEALRMLGNEHIPHPDEDAD